MPAKRFFRKGPLKKGQNFTISGDELRHLRTVMKAKEREQLELVNGKGILALVRVEKYTKREAELSCLKLEKAKADRPLVLFQGIPKWNHLDWVLEKGVELGLTKLYLFPADRSEVFELSENRKSRLEAVAAAALKQSGRLFLPEICMLPPISEWKKLDAPTAFGKWDDKAKFIALEGRELPNFVNGPEGGLSEEEIKKLESLGAIPVKLHHLTLRCETAAVLYMGLQSLAQEQCSL